MDAERRQRIQNICDAALRCAASQRTAFLKVACSGDEELRQEVESLIARQCSETGAQAVAAQPVTAEAESSLLGKQIGNYQVLSFIGEGGQAKVYRARDKMLGREAAIKVLPEELSASPQIMSRLEKEACLASSLNHPNIITIYGIHRADANLFIAMELVDGRTLHEVLGDGPMPIPTVLDVAAQIAAGLSKAHEAGIVHRDLKSRNVMINKDGIVKILDFGLGKVTIPLGQLTDQMQTAVSTKSESGFGAIIGTVNYMSPQQASGYPLDFHSDQFSFGVLLYELITGKLPFERATAAQTLASIIEDEPEAVSKLNPRAPAALRRIVERCLSKNPENRYASTSDLARELRELRDTLIKKPLPFRLRKIWLGLLLIAVLLAGVFSQFTPRLQKAYRTLFSLTPREIHLAVLPFANVGNDPANQAFCVGMADFLTNQLSQLEQFQENLSIVPASEVLNGKITSVHDARKMFGVTMAITGSVQRASNQVRLAINLVDATNLRQIGGRWINAEARDITVLQAEVLLVAADLIEMKLTRQAKTVLAAGATEKPGAYEFYLKGLGYLQQYGVIDNIDKAIGLFKSALAEDPKYALAHAALGEAYWRKYGLTKEAQWAEEATRSCETALKFDDTLAPVVITLGIIEAGTGRYEEAVQNLKKAQALNPANPDAYRELGKAYFALGKLKDAEATFKQAIAVQPKLWSSHNALGGFYFHQGRYREAELEYRKILEINPDNETANGNLGAMYFQQKRYEEAAAMFQRIAAAKPDDSAYSNLGVVYFYLGRYSDAARAMERATKLNDKTSLYWFNLASAYQWSPGEREKARAAFARAAELAEQEIRINPRDAALIMRQADCYSNLNQPKRSRGLLRQALALASDDVEIMSQAANVYEQLGDRAQALEWIDKAIRHGYSMDLIERSPTLAQLRADPRFQELRSH
jgi:serine/threonine protein kinase/Flp pilus assembly protein TadD